MNKSETKKYIQDNILNTYKLYEPLNNEHFVYMLDILKLHPESEIKIGCGVSSMWVNKNSYGSRNFWLQRTDGSQTDFSFIKCLTKFSPKTIFSMCCRKEIDPFIIDFRNKAFVTNEKLPCAITGILVAKHESHIDHDDPFPFFVLIDKFIIDNNIVFKDSIVHNLSDGVIGGYSLEPKIKELWIKFHNENAKLRVLSIKANLTRKYNI